MREIYDDNIYTSKTNTVASFNTDLAPSILVDIPMDDGGFSARYTFHMTYYSNRPGNAFDYSHEFITQYRHTFSERFNLNLADQFRYFTEPSAFENVGTPYRSGAYYANTINAGFNAQWTPLFGTSTTYANTIIKYESSSIGNTQDSVENTGAQNFQFAILPKINLVFGGIVDNISYDDIARGYTSYTGDTGLDWQALPSLSLGGRVGGTYTDAQQGNSLVSPYGSFTLNWQLGSRSSLSFNYSHSVVPTDVITAEGQVADRISTTFKYDILPSLTAHLQAGYTYGVYTQNLTTPGTTPDFTENDFVMDTGLSYHLNRHFDFDVGYILNGISSEQSFRDYTRNQFYLGIRGTY